MELGTIKFYDAEKKFGFIKHEDDHKDDLFFHVTGLRANYTPKEGQSVKFDIGEGRKGPVAVNVEKAGL